MGDSEREIRRNKQLGKPGCKRWRIILKLTVKKYDMRVCKGSMFSDRANKPLDSAKRGKFLEYLSHY
jgi:hypothetical protein